MCGKTGASTHGTVQLCQALELDERALVAAEAGSENSLESDTLSMRTKP